MEGNIVSLPQHDYYGSLLHIYTYVAYIYTHTHTHTHTYMYMFLDLIWQTDNDLGLEAKRQKRAGWTELGKFYNTTYNLTVINKNKNNNIKLSLYNSAQSVMFQEHLNCYSMFGK